MVKKTFSVDEANAMLPLLRCILRDITALATDLKDRHQRILHLQSEGSLDQAHQEEIDQLVSDFERDQARMAEFENELQNLGVELKDYFTGLVDFRHVRNGREIYLCWRLGEPEVGHWHELDEGFAGRQKLDPDWSTRLR